MANKCGVRVDRAYVVDMEEFSRNIVGRKAGLFLCWDEQCNCNQGGS